MALPYVTSHFLNQPMSTSHKSKISHLELVFPPISSQDAVLIKNEPAIESLMRQSDFYMIGGKAQYEFTSISLDEAGCMLTFSISSGNQVLDQGAIHLAQLPFIAIRGISNFSVYYGKSFIAISDGPQSAPETRLLERFTPENIIWHRSRGLPGIAGLNRYTELLIYDLLYVGIAKVGDSYDRLIAKGHLARMEILSNEPQRYPGARVSDEIILFLFKVEPMFIQQFEPEHEFCEEDLLGAYDSKRIVADAEKAFVSLLQPQYNVVKFKNYPKGKDGLYDSGVERYSYSIGEVIAFNTAHGRIKGGRHPIMGAISKDADFIYVEGDKVSLFVSGVDFASTNCS